MMSTAAVNPWFEELDMEDPLLLQEFIGDCLVDYSPEEMGPFMDEGLHRSLSSGPDCNPSTATADHHMISTSSAKRQKVDDHHPCSLNPMPIEAILSLVGADINNGGLNNDGTTQKSSTQTDSGLSLESSDKHPGTKTTKKKPKRQPEQCQNHIIAERQRRQTLSERFIALSALIPGLKKLDKTSVLGEAINHMKQLKERLTTLEEESARRAVESVVVVKRSQVIAENDSETGSGSANQNKQLPEIEARFSDKCVLLKIQCKLEKGLLVKLLTEIERLHLSVTNTHAMPFNATTVDITIMAQMEVEFDMTPQDVVKVLRSIFQ